MKILFVLFSFLFLFSCKENEIVYLYDENSPEWPQIQALRYNKCKEESIYKEIDKTNQFNRFSVGTRYLFKRTKKVDSGAEVSQETYGLHITSVTASSITIALKIPNGNLFHYNLSQTASEGIVNIVTDGTCYNKYTKSTSGSGLRFIHKLRKVLEANPDTTKDPIRYDEYTRSFNISPEYPSFFHMFRGTVTLKEVQNTTEVASTTEYRHTLSGLDCSQTENEKYCNLSGTPIICDTNAQTSSPPYNLDSFTSSDTEATLVRFTGDASCPDHLF